MITPKRVLGGLFQNLSLKIFSGLIALVLWIVVLGSRRVEGEKMVPIELRTPEGLVASGDVPTYASFRLEGPKTVLKGIMERREEAIVVDLSKAKAGEVEFRFFKGQLEVSNGAHVIGVSPEVVRLQLEAVHVRELPVKADLRGSVDLGLRVADVHLTPSTVRVRGPKSKIDQMDEVRTRPIQLTALHRDFLERVPLELRQDGVTVESEIPEVSVRVVAKSANLRIPRVNIELRGRADATLALPDRVAAVFVRAFGRDAARSAEVAEVKAFVDLKGLAAGSHLVPIKVELPDSMVLFQVVPAQVRVSIP